MSISTISAPAPQLVGVSDPTIKDMVNLLPDFSTGDQMHQLYVNKLMGSLPGNYSQLIGTGPSFRSIFFLIGQPRI